MYVDSRESVRSPRVDPFSDSTQSFLFLEVQLVALLEAYEYFAYLEQKFCCFPLVPLVEIFHSSTDFVFNGYGFLLRVPTGASSSSCSNCDSAVKACSEDLCFKLCMGHHPHSALIDLFDIFRI